MAEQSGSLHCSFCDKSQYEVKKLIQGPDVWICEECIDLCNEILLEENFVIPTLGPAKRGSAFTEFTPIFQVEGIEHVPGKCFYVGPFSDPFNEIYTEFIALPLRREGYIVERGDELFKANAVIEEVWEGIYSSGLVIAELTAKNPNVLYEVGIAHTIGRPVVLIAQSVDDIPFDLRHRRCILYSYTPGGCRKLENGILDAVRRLIGTRVDDGSFGNRSS